jgi:hypothetical protein
MPSKPPDGEKQPKLPVSTLLTFHPWLSAGEVAQLVIYSFWGWMCLWVLIINAILMALN